MRPPRWAEAWVRRVWRGEAGPAGTALSGLLLPSALLFRGVARLRAVAYDRGLARIYDPPLPVLSVGNLTVGGTGKTPVVGWAVRELAGRGLRPAILSRGYGEDELRLHRRWNPDVPIHAHPDRARAAAEAAAAGADVAVLDDGFQHRRLGRRADWVLLAAEQPRPARVLPRGPYREPPSALRRATLVVVTRKGPDLEESARTAEWARRHAPDVPLVHLHLAPGGWADLLGRPADPPAGPALAVAGIGEPETLSASARSAGSRDVRLLAFPDHHAYTAADAARIREEASGRSVVTTEKDAVRLAPLADLLPEVRVLRLRLEIDAGAGHLHAALDRFAAAARAGREGRPGAPRIGREDR